MGVKNLWKIINECGEKPEFNGKTLAVDSSIWMHQYKEIANDTIISSISKRIFKILYNGIKPVFVFDGSAPSIKKQTLETRKKEKMKNLLRGISRNKECKICKKPLKDCIHTNDFDEKALEKLYNEVLVRIKEHKYNLGELSEELSYEKNNEESTESMSDKKNEKHLNNQASNEDSDSIVPNDKRTNVINSNLLSENKIIDNSIEHVKSLINRNKYIKIISPETNEIVNDQSNDVLSDINRHFKTSKTHQLNDLLELRKNRKISMKLDNDNIDKFSLDQIENVERRNTVTTMIKNLNKNFNSVVQSDWSIFSELKKEKNAKKNTLIAEEDIKDDVEERLLEEKIQKTIDEEIDDIFACDKTNDDINEYFSDNFEKYRKNIKLNIEYSLKQNLEIAKKIANSSNNTSKSLYDIINQANINNVKIINEINELDQKTDIIIDKNEIDTKDIKDNVNNEIDIKNNNDSDASTNLSELDDLIGSSDSISENIEILNSIKKQLDKYKIKKIDQDCFGSDEPARVKEILIELLVIFGIPYIYSPGETDPQCYYLF